MTLPSTITTKHGEYEYTMNVMGNICYWYENGHKKISIDEHDGDWDGMTLDEVIEFLQAYKEATNE